MIGVSRRIWLFSLTMGLTGSGMAPCALGNGPYQPTLSIPPELESEFWFGPPYERRRYRYLIEFAAPALLERQTAHTTDERLDSDAPDMQVEKQELAARQADDLRAMADILGREIMVSRRCPVTRNGMVVWLEPAEADAVAGLAGVLAVERDRIDSSASDSWCAESEAYRDGAERPVSIMRPGLPNSRFFGSDNVNQPGFRPSGRF